MSANKLLDYIEENIKEKITLVELSELIHYSHRCSLADVVVNPAFQNQGLATRLFQEACNIAIEMEFECVMTACRGDGTEHFYKSLGMQECGRIPKGIYEPWGEHNRYDEVILLKELK